jgi:hypothetical protein
MTRRLTAPALALLALATAQTASAQAQTCVRASDLSDGVVYAMPIAYDAMRNACANRLARNGFVATRGDAFITDFRTRQSAAWPGALRLLKSIMADEAVKDAGSGADLAAMIGTVPQETLRPFADLMIGQLIADEIKGEDCGTIERGMELVSPLPAGNVGALIAFIAELVKLETPSVCPAAAAAQSK